MMRLGFLTFAILTLLSSALAPSRANAYIEVNGFYFSDGLKTTSSTTYSRMFIDASVGFSIDKKSRYLAGWNYTMQSSTDTTTTSTTYSSSQMGPRFVIGLDKNNSWSLGFGYYLVTKATYSDGAGSSSSWKGTALKVDFGYSMPISEDFLLGVRMNYSSASYTEQLIGSTDYSTIAYTRTSIYPSLYAIYLF